MKGYALFEIGKDRPIKIPVEVDIENHVEVLVFATKQDLLSSTDVENKFEEIRKVEISCQMGQRT